MQYRFIASSLHSKSSTGRSKERERVGAHRAVLENKVPGKNALLSVLRPPPLGCPFFLAIPSSLDSFKD
ncbi:unnamed protein product [Lasius platythorax]|uniref:Uncharacterized protein n=1 Tax=Lasius platythorax TaxID=488582 RepID=A0AAV2P5J3_9HYME